MNDPKTAITRQDIKRVRKTTKIGMPASRPDLPKIRKSQTPTLTDMAEVSPGRYIYINPDTSKIEDKG